MKTSKRLLSILLMLTMLLSMFTVMASADDPEEPCMHVDGEGNTTFTIFHAAATATCFQEGHVAYYECKTCHAEAIKNEDAGKFEVQLNGVTKAKDPTNHGGKLSKTPAQEPTCAANGNYEYYYCSGCNKYFKDEDGKTLFIGSVVIPATGEHTLEPVPAKDPTCTEDGYEAYWECSVCGQKFSDAEGKNKISAPKEIEATGHKIVSVRGNPATCTDKGVKDHYECARTGCGALFGDKAGTKPLTDKDVVIPATGHTMTEHKAVAPTCTKDGTKAYWTCSVCSKSFEDNAGTTEIKDLDTWKVVPMLGHKLKKVEAKAPTQTEEGNIEYWYCETCGRYFLDKDAKYETTKDEVVLEKLAEEEHVLTFTIGKNGKLAYADDGREIASGRTKALKSDDKALKLVATADKNHKVVWQLDNGKKHYEGSTAKITISYKDLNVKSELKVWFEEITTELDLTVKVSGSSNGEVYYKVNDGSKTKLTTTKKTWGMDDTKDQVKFWIYPDSGYKAVLQFNDGKKYTYTYDDSVVIDYSDLDGEDGTLYVSFVKKGSSDVDDYPTLTFDITGGKHGTVYRGTREYEDGDVISIKKNDKMTFKAKADKGYVAVWTYKGDTYVGDEYTVKMGATDAKLYVEFMDKDDIRLTELPFRDVSKRDWYYDDVVYVYRKGYMDGMSSTRFGGELNTTRGQIVTILWRLTGEPRATKRNPFTDVSSSQYYYDAISWAYDAGVVDGFDARTFKPDQNVTREQLAAILYRYAKYMNLSTSGSAYLAKYTDADKIANWAYDAMAWANYRGLINGTSATRIDPKGYATRAQIAAILHRFAVEYGA